MILLQIAQSADTIAAAVTTDATVIDTIQLAITVKSQTNSASPTSWIREWLPVLLLVIGGMVTYWFNKRLAQEKLRLDKELELEKLQIQKRNLKFTSYHAKEVEILTHLYSIIAQASREFDLKKMDWLMAKYHLLSDKELDKLVLEGEEKQNLIKQTKAFHNAAGEYHDKIKFYSEDNALFLDSTVKPMIQELVNKLFFFVVCCELFSRNNPRLGKDDFALMVKAFKSADKKLIESLTLINQTVKELMKD